SGVSFEACSGRTVGTSTTCECGRGSEALRPEPHPSASTANAVSPQRSRKFLRRCRVRVAMIGARAFVTLVVTCAAPTIVGCSLFFPVPATGKGCKGEAAGFYPAPDVVRLRAANDLSCPRAEIRVVARDDTTFFASGCGKNDVYTCEADAV